MSTFIARQVLSTSAVCRLRWYGWACLVGLAVCACGDDADGDATTDSSVDSSVDGVADADDDADGTTPCAFPNGTCAADDECGDAGRCFGLSARCKGVCGDEQPNEEDCAGKSAPKLRADVLAVHGNYVVTVKNVGCGPAYLVQGCCGEDDPAIERFADGSFGAAQCKPFTSPCCGAEPRCVKVERGDTVSVSGGALGRKTCCGTTFRVRLSYAAKEACLESVARSLTVVSAPVHAPQQGCK